MVQHAVVAGRQRVGRVWSTVRLQYAAPGTQPPQMIARLHHYVAVRQTLDDGANLVNGLKCNTCVHHNTSLRQRFKKIWFQTEIWVGPLNIKNTASLSRPSYRWQLARDWVSECLCLKKRPNFETLQLKITRIDFDDIWQKNSKVCRTEFACCSFHVGLLVINFSSFKSDTENNSNFDAESSKCANVDAVQ